MLEPKQKRMTFDEFLAWAEEQDGRWELIDGVPVAMAPERVIHLVRKAAVHAALRAAIKASGLDCHALPDGATVKTADGNSFEPDALVYCGPKLPGDAIVVENPVIIVEVSSPSTGKTDTGIKLAGYFSIPSVQHYLIVHPDGPPVIHHRRAPGATPGDDILTRIVPDGRFRLDPPGLDLEIQDLFSD
jgi:Uma2 family endonuclease